MEMVRLVIDNKEVCVQKGTSILNASKQSGIEIPTLCYLEKLNEIGACRICTVEVEGEDKLVAACNTEVKDGMVIHTNSPKVRQARKINLELILSEHDCHCPTCVRNGNCKLQTLAGQFNITENPFKGKIEENKSYNFPLIRNNSKCIKCMRCVQVCDKIQGLNVWDILNTGKRTTVDVRHGIDIARKCSLCGQCITHCPVGALKIRDDTDTVYDALADESKITVIQIAPAVRTAWAEGLGIPKEEATEKRMVSAIKALGFDYVFDTDFSADLTIMEEGTEFIQRLTKGGKLPMFTSCCPGWVRFMKSEYPELTDNLSTAKSPQQMFGAVIKSYFAEKKGIDPKNIFSVSVMPCTAKKYEAAIPRLNDACGDRDVDASITTRELAQMIRADHIDVKNLPESEFDSPLGTATGAGVIFGATGGVMEAALRTAYKLVTGSNPDADSFTMVRGLDDRKEAELDINGTRVSVAVTSGLKNTRNLVEDIKSGRKHYDFVEVMACPGGCSGGGGQPIHDGEEHAGDRGAMLYNLDKSYKYRFSHENPEIKTIYEEYFEKPCSHKSHVLLHTDLKEWEL